MATHSVERHLHLGVEDYDREIRRLVPHYDEMVDEGIGWLEKLVPEDARVLDLGCGTGRLTAAILSRMPAATVVLLDIDPAILDQARRRLEGERRVAFVEGSFFEPLPKCDAIVASLSLHHVQDLGAKTQVYRAIHEVLPPGMPFLNLDATVSGDPEFSKRTIARWVDGMKAQGIDEAAAKQNLVDWAEEEHYFSLRDEFEALRAAGFAEPECFWRRGSVAVFGARRSG